METKTEDLFGSCARSMTMTTARCIQQVNRRLACSLSSTGSICALTIRACYMTIVNDSLACWRIVDMSFPFSESFPCLQSHGVFGYVGGKAAVFLLQCLGYDVDV